MKKHAVTAISATGIADSTRRVTYPNMDSDLSPRHQVGAVGWIKYGAAPPKGRRRRVLDGYSDLLSQRVRWMSDALLTKPVTLGETTFWAMYQ